MSEVCHNVKNVVKYCDTEIDALTEVYWKLAAVCNYGRISFIAEFIFTLFS
jgi:hypothetical protein